MVIALCLFFALGAVWQIYVTLKSKNSGVRRISGGLGVVAVILFGIALIGTFFHEIFFLFCFAAFLPLAIANLYYRFHCNDCGVAVGKFSQHKGSYTFCDQCAPKNLYGNENKN